MRFFLLAVASLLVAAQAGAGIASASAASSRPAIFLIPGASSSGDRIYLQGLNWILQLIPGNDYFSLLRRTLEYRGADVEVCPESTDWDQRTLSERAEECVSQILRSRGLSTCENAERRDVVIYGHSMGGLIGRLLAQDPRVKGCIHSVTTAGTPHQGTPIADFAIEHVERGGAWGLIVELVGFDPWRARYLPELRVDRSRAMPGQFTAQDIPDNPEVQYFSFSESQPIILVPPLEVMRKIIANEMYRRGLQRSPFGYRNDGVVPVAEGSATPII